VFSELLANTVSRDKFNVLAGNFADTYLIHNTDGTKYLSQFNTNGVRAEDRNEATLEQLWVFKGITF
jgi:hypothetical protein